MSSNPPPHTSLIHSNNLFINGGNYFQQNTNNDSEQGERSRVKRMTAQYMTHSIGLSILLKAASPSACHDASDRDPPPRCAPGTREKVIADIMDWIKQASPDMSVMWLNGPFGNGKSAIMQTIADKLRDDTSLNHLLAASFFFSRGKPDRDKAKSFIPTIAYQIAINVPDARQVINKALIQDPTILSKSIDAQLRYLITKPLYEVTCYSSLYAPFHTPTVIIDGLDECEGHASQRLILKAITTAVFKEHTPLRFLIASRPEPQISETFSTEPLDQHHYPITLVCDYKTDEDLRRFLRSRFDEICRQRFGIVSTVERPWPSEEDLSTLVYRASGQFLYASTVLKFVDSDTAHPTHQLTLILQRRSGNAFSNMDELYMEILESCPRQEILPSFLHSLLTEDVLHSRHSSWDIWFLRPTLADHSAISGLLSEDVSVILRWLPAIIEVERPPKQDLPYDWPLQQIMQLYSPKLSIHHESFIEFLTDPSRSGKFHVDMDVAYHEIKVHLDALLAECLSKGYGDCTFWNCKFRLRTRSEQSPRIYRYTWVLAHSLLVEDLVAHGLEPSFGWPRLQKTLGDFKEGVIPPLSKPCPEFLDALSYVLDAMKCSLETYVSAIPGNDLLLVST